MSKQVVSFKFEPSLLTRVDEGASAAKLNRSQFVFRLLEQGLRGEGQVKLTDENFTATAAVQTLGVDGGGRTAASASSPGTQTLPPAVPVSPEAKRRAELEAEFPKAKPEFIERALRRETRGF